MEIKIEYPSNLSQETRLFMNAVIEKLSGVDSISNCDLGAIRMMMLSYDVYVKASNEVLERGPLVYDKRNRAKINPAVSLTTKKYIEIVTIMKEFGLTVKSREHIKAMTDEVDQDNPLYQFLKNND